MNYVVIDWFEVFVDEPQGFSLQVYEEAGCSVLLRDYSTRVYAEVAEIFDPALSVSFEVRRSPKSTGVLAVGACHLRLPNDQLYKINAAVAVDRILQKYGLKYRSISRIDVCTDFVTFDSGIRPESFLKRVLGGVYRRSEQGLRKDIVQERWDSVTPNYMAWKNGDIMIRLYDKTLELRQVATPLKRSYISALWAQYGLISKPHAIFDLGVPHVWRLEIQISSQSRGWVKVGKSGYFQNDLDTWASPSESEELFKCLVESYFAFYVFKKSSEVSDCKRVDLFRFGRDIVRLGRVSDQEINEASTSHRLALIVAKLDSWIADLTLSQIRPSLVSLRSEALSMLRSESNLSPDEIAALRRKMALMEGSLFND